LLVADQFATGVGVTEKLPIPAAALKLWLPGKTAPGQTGGAVMLRVPPVENVPRIPRGVVDYIKLHVPFGLVPLKTDNVEP